MWQGLLLLLFSLLNFVSSTTVVNNCETSYTSCGSCAIIQGCQWCEGSNSCLSDSDISLCTSGLIPEGPGCEDEEFVTLIEFTVGESLMYDIQVDECRSDITDNDGIIDIDEIIELPFLGDLTFLEQQNLDDLYDFGEISCGTTYSTINLIVISSDSNNMNYEFIASLVTWSNDTNDVLISETDTDTFPPCELSVTNGFVSSITCAAGEYVQDSEITLDYNSETAELQLRNILLLTSTLLPRVDSQLYDDDGDCTHNNISESVSVGSAIACRNVDTDSDPNTITVSMSYDLESVVSYDCGNDDGNDTLLTEPTRDIVLEEFTIDLSGRVTSTQVSETVVDVISDTSPDENDIEVTQAMYDIYDVRIIMSLDTSDIVTVTDADIQAERDALTAGAVDFGYIENILTADLYRASSLQGDEYCTLDIDDESRRRMEELKEQEEDPVRIARREEQLKRASADYKRMKRQEMRESRRGLLQSSGGGSSGSSDCPTDVPSTQPVTGAREEYEIPYGLERDLVKFEILGIEIKLVLVATAGVYLQWTDDPTKETPDNTGGCSGIAGLIIRATPKRIRDQANDCCNTQKNEYACCGVSKDDADENFEDCINGITWSGTGVESDISSIFGEQSIFDSFVYYYTKFKYCDVDRNNPIGVFAEAGLKLTLGGRTFFSLTVCVECDDPAADQQGDGFEDNTEGVLFRGRYPIIWGITLDYEVGYFYGLYLNIDLVFPDPAIPSIGDTYAFGVEVQPGFAAGIYADVALNLQLVKAGLYVEGTLVDISFPAGMEVSLDTSNWEVTLTLYFNFELTVAQVTISIYFKYVNGIKCRFCCSCSWKWSDRINLWSKTWNLGPTVTWTLWSKTWGNSAGGTSKDYVIDVDIGCSLSAKATGLAESITDYDWSNLEIEEIFNLDASQYNFIELETSATQGETGDGDNPSTLYSVIFALRARLDEESDAADLRTLISTQTSVDATENIMIDLLHQAGIVDNSTDTINCDVQTGVDITEVDYTKPTEGPTLAPTQPPTNAPSDAPTVSPTFCDQGVLNWLVNDDFIVDQSYLRLYSPCDDINIVQAEVNRGQRQGDFEHSNYFLKFAICRVGESKIIYEWGTNDVDEYSRISTRTFHKIQDDLTYLTWTVSRGYSGIIPYLQINGQGNIYRNDWSTNNAGLAYPFGITFTIFYEKYESEYENGIAIDLDIGDWDFQSSSDRVYHVQLELDIGAFPDLAFYEPETDSVTEQRSGYKYITLDTVYYLFLNNQVVVDGVPTDIVIETQWLTSTQLILDLIIPKFTTSAQYTSSAGVI